MKFQLFAAGIGPVELIIVARGRTLISGRKLRGLRSCGISLGEQSSRNTPDPFFLWLALSSTFYILFALDENKKEKERKKSVELDARVAPWCSRNWQIKQPSERSFSEEMQEISGEPHPPKSSVGCSFSIQTTHPLTSRANKKPHAIFQS